MPGNRVVFIRKFDGKVPIKDWPDDLPKQDLRKCLERIARLKEAGYTLERPFAAYLRDGIHELRVRSGNVNYRMLYFFHEGHVVVITHGCIMKTARVPYTEMDRALEQKGLFQGDPDAHTFLWAP